MKQYIIIAAIIAALVAAYKWKDIEVDRAKLEIEGVRKSNAMLETELRDAASVNAGALHAAEIASREIERQKLIAAAEAKKSRQRLDAFNALNRKISNVPTSENVPVSDHIEHVLDELRSAVPGGGQAADRPNEGGTGGAPDPAGHELPAETAPTS